MPTVFLFMDLALGMDVP